jgi:hypothetical protein
MVKVCIEISPDFGARKGQVLSGIVVESNYDAVLKAVQNKMQLKKKQADQVTLCSLDFTGEQALARGDLSNTLLDGARVIVRLGESSVSSSVYQAAQPRVSKKVQKAVDQLHLVSAGLGSLSARGRPSLETLAALQQHKSITGVVTLLQHDESSGYAQQLGEACERLGLKWWHAPLAGPKAMGLVREAVPRLSQEDLDSFKQIRHIKQQLELTCEKLVVHCAAGLHRTGLFLYLLLRELGASPESALEKLRQMRQETCDEFMRMNFLDKAEAILVTMRSDNQDASGAVVASVEVAAAREAAKDNEEEGDFDKEGTEDNEDNALKDVT